MTRSLEREAPIKTRRSDSVAQYRPLVEPKSGWYVVQSIVGALRTGA